jgi:hypothetical protein
LQVKLPLTQLDLAGLSDLSASVDLSSLDSLLAVGLPCLLALLALPVCLARAAMLGLDCIAVKSQVQIIKSILRYFESHTSIKTWQFAINDIYTSEIKKKKKKQF